ncbi:MAG: hypothetical protein DRG78_20160 [Epsilonproteobacteria bacterium]|nr:MAG: hypothetical protein DRG78_20160 [Campylobacterota bacterium]
MTFSNHIETIKKDLKLTQDEIAGIMKINNKTYSMRVKGDGLDFSLREICLFSEYLDSISYNKTPFLSQISKACRQERNYDNEEPFTITIKRGDTIDIKIEPNKGL